MSNIKRIRYGNISIGKKDVIKTYDPEYFDVMIKEYALTNLFRNYDGIYTIKELDCVNMKTYTDNYGINLREWISIKHRKDKEKTALLQKVVEIINIIHHHNIAHGDLTMENIVINKKMFNKPTVHLIDFSNANLSEYIDPNLTSPVYQEPIPSKGLSHDIWSLGIIFLEVYTENILLYAPSNTKIKILIDLIPISMQKIVSGMLTSKTKFRVTALQLLSQLGLKSIKNIVRIPVLHHNMIAEGRKFSVWYYDETEKSNIIHREHGLAALIYFIQKKNIPPVYYNIYAICMLIILTYLYDGKCTIDWALKSKEHKYDEILSVIYILLNDKEVIDILYLYDNAMKLFKDVNDNRSSSSNSISNISDSGTGD